MKFNSGCSQAKFKDDGEILFKYYDSTNTKLYEQYFWLKRMSQDYPDFFPKIYNWETIGYRMEYLDSSEKIINDKDFANKINNIILEISNNEYFYKKIEDYKFEDTYIPRLEKHIQKFKSFNVTELSQDEIVINNQSYRNSFDILKEIKKYSKYFNMFKTNCHGDLTIENIILKNNKINLIDSNFLYDGWNSYLLDLSKIFQSFHYSYEKLFTDVKILNINNVFYIDLDYINTSIEHFQKIIDNDLVYRLVSLLEITHYIRMFKYKYLQSKTDLYKSYLIYTLLVNEYKEKYR